MSFRPANPCVGLRLRLFQPVHHARMSPASAADAEFGCGETLDHAFQNYERMLQINPGNFQARLYSVIPLWRLRALAGAEGAMYLRQALSILQDLDAQDRLDGKRKQRIPQIEAQLAKLS